VFSLSFVTSSCIFSDSLVNAMSKSTSVSTILYLRQRLQGLKIYETSDLIQHINTFDELVGEQVSVDVKIEEKTKDMILLCSLSPLLTTLTCSMVKVAASLRFPNERWLEVITKEPRAFVYHNFLVILFHSSSKHAYIAREHMFLS